VVSADSDHRLLSGNPSGCVKVSQYNIAVKTVSRISPSHRSRIFLIRSVGYPPRMVNGALLRKSLFRRPRSGLNENSPALQRWEDWRLIDSPWSGRLIRRTIPSDFRSAVRFTDCLSTTSLDPTDQSVGYCHSSASPTFPAKPVNGLSHLSF